MELLRRAGQGRMAELLGADLLPTDRELWRAGVPQLATKLEANASAQTLALVDRYLAGVNAAITAYPLLPPEFLLLGADRPAWRRRDVFALGALMAFQSANNMSNELLRLALAHALDAERFALFLNNRSARGSYPFVIPATGRGAALARAIDRLSLTDPASNPLMPRLGFGSNGWVVAPGRSASGFPLYAFDSHDELGLPDLFYEVHLFFGEGRQLRGWSVAGLPGVINGFNENIAWGFTNIGDTQDLFLETRSPDDPLLFRDGDQWYRARTETVSIPVTGGDPAARWQGMVPAEDMPELSNPASGFLAAANAGVNAAGDWTDGQAQLLLPALLQNLDTTALDPTASAANGRPWSAPH